MSDRGSPPSRSLSPQWTWHSLAGDSPDDVVKRWQTLAAPLSVPGANTRLWHCGAGEPVICLHGVPASSFAYRKVLPELARLGVHGIAMDFPGMGLADRPQDFDFSWTGLSRWLVDALNALAYDRFHLVVHDIAGPIAFEYARIMSGHIRSITVLDSIVCPTSYRRPWMMAPLFLPLIDRLYTSATNDYFFESVMRREGIVSQVPSAEIRAYLHLLKREDNARAFLRIMKGFVCTPDFEYGIHTALRMRDYPAQLIWGRQDRALPLSQLGREAQEVLGLEMIHQLPGGHFLQEDSPEALAKQIVRFCREAI